jgi:hypothetical protein
MFVIIFSYMGKFLQTSSLHSLCVSHAFLMYHLYDGRIGSSVPKKYGHKEDGIRTFCSHGHSTGSLLKICLVSIEMSHNCPRNKSLIFLLITCSGFFPHLFGSLQLHGDVELDHLSTRMKFYSLNFP